MKKSVTLLLAVIVLFSCTSRTIYKKPKDLIDRDKMISIWVDLFIAKGAKNVKTKDLRKNINYVPLVLKKYQIDSVQFSKSNIYYVSRIDEYQEMFEEVQNRLKKLQKANELKPEKNPVLPAVKLDSIKRKKQRLLENTMK